MTTPRIARWQSIRGPTSAPVRPTSSWANWFVSRALAFENRGSLLAVAEANRSLRRYPSRYQRSRLRFSREISCRSLRARPQSSRHSKRMKFVGPVSGAYLRERWIASQYVVFSGGRCAPTILVRPAGQFASAGASSAELGASSRCWTSAAPVAGPRFSIRKDERS